MAEINTTKTFMGKTGLKNLNKEEWKPVRFHKGKGIKYAISSYGRLVRYTKKIEDGSILTGSRQGGYPIWRYSWFEEGVRFNGACLIHKMVCEAFLPKPPKNKKFIIHLDFNKENNKVSNLQWATQEEITKHNSKNPAVIAAREAARLRIQRTNSKLTEKNVIRIKKMLSQKKTLRYIAGQFGVTDMQIYRIKTGQNWADVEATS